jgi:HSP20 family protein
MNADDLQIHIENNVLTIKGEIRKQNEEKQRNYHRVERRFGSFQRTVALPTTVKADAISASLNNGMLRLDIPKAEEVKPRRIAVNVGSEKSIDVSNN